MKRLNLVAFIVAFAACSYINGKGDAEESAAAWVRDNLPGATFSNHECQDRDTDDNGYVSCTVSVRWENDPGIEIIPIECSVNRAGNGCGNKGCRPLATFRTHSKK